MEQKITIIDVEDFLVWCEELGIYVNEECDCVDYDAEATSNYYRECF